VEEAATAGRAEETAEREKIAREWWGGHGET
jgi:hypothetical protein